MSRIATDAWQDVWSDLQARKLAPMELAQRVAAADIVPALRAGTDYSGRRHFLLPLGEGETDLHDEGSRGLTVKTRELAGENLPMGRYIDIECMDVTGYAAFDLIGSDISEMLAEERLRPSDAVRKVLGKWRRFWGQTPTATLSAEAHVGLFGEVWFMVHWLLPRVGEKCVEAWRGPTGGRHDFEWEVGSVEVKATTSTRGRIHHINGLDQLDPPIRGPLFVFSIRLREEVAATNSLSSIIELCSSRLAKDAGALDLFEERLAEAGYSPLHVEHYKDRHFRVVEEALFEVQEDFPRISTGDFAHGVAGGIEEVEYTINLNSYDHLCVARLPEEANSLAW